MSIFWCFGHSLSLFYIVLGLCFSVLGQDFYFFIFLFFLSFGVLDEKNNQLINCMVTRQFFSIQIMH
jgi:hypothetical protein